MKIEEVKLGDRIRDMVTGIEGVCIGKTDWITGCSSVHIQYVNGDNNVQQESFDINRAEYVNSDVHDKMFGKKTEEKEEEVKGGPQKPIKQPNRI